MDALDSKLSSVFAIHDENIPLCDLEVGVDYIVYFSKSHMRKMHNKYVDRYSEPARIFVYKHGCGSVFVSCNYHSTEPEPLTLTDLITHLNLIPRMVGQIIRVRS